MLSRLAVATTCGMALVLFACAPAVGDDPTITAVLVTSNLDAPLYVTHAPGDFDRIFIVEQPGTIRIVDISENPPVLQAAPFLDIRSRVRDMAFEQGLLGLAFHPDYQSNGFFYVNYTGPGDNTRISRFQVSAGAPNDADEASEFIVLAIAQPQPNHNGGWIEFGPDGFLYIASGDGGGGGDEDDGHTPETGNAQDTTDNLLGKILRIDVDGTNAPSGNYGIPIDNPFVGIAGDDEIWAYGLRNPWRNSFDRLTGDLYITDVGQADWEEINFQPGDSAGGENWGWRCREGAHDFNFGDDCPSQTLLDPIHEYFHDTPPFPCSITGGEVYRGCAMPELQGTYFFADYCTHRIWSFRYTGTVKELADRTAELASSGASITSISSFGHDAEGELYICSLDHGVFKIVPTGVAATCLSEVPTLSSWGLVLMALAIMIAATLMIQRRPEPCGSARAD